MNITISGKIIRGKKRGRKLGFPTVNIELNDKIECGVYAGSVKVGAKNYKAGIFVSPDEKLLEVHIIGFSGDLYGKEIEVEIIRRIRDVMKFESEEALKKQIERDIELISKS